MSTAIKTRRRTGIAKILGGLLLCATPFLLTSSSIPNLLERIIDEGVLPVLSSNGPITYYEGRFGYTGFEYELAEAFADYLGVELVVSDEPNLGNMLSAVGQEGGRFAANGLSITEERQEHLRFSSPYMQVEQQVIYRRGSPRPKTIQDLIGKDIVVVANSSHLERLKKLQQSFPELQWRTVEDIEQLDLLEMVHNERAEITIIDSTAYIVNRSVYPRARLAFSLPGNDDIAWVFPKGGDSSLYKAANQFLNEFKQSQKLQPLIDKYFSVEFLDEGSALALSKHIDTRLPQWIPHFQQAGNEFGLDWLFLAAMSYQESLWNAKARSYTGVRGLMMLTQQTAKELGVKDRTDPQQSIYGGAKYFTYIVGRIPERIPTPDRLWMALAAYNVGFGHLEDARIITQQQGGNPDKWEDVKQRLPLLSKRKYFRHTKHGYARGWEPVHYVENIRNYHNILVWHHESQQRRLALDLQNEIEPVNFSRSQSRELPSL